MMRILLIVALLLAIAYVPVTRQTDSVHIGSKKFTEAVILGELLVHLCRHHEIPVIHYAELGGTRILYEALRQGEIDAYVEYTGTLREEIFGDSDITDTEIQQRLQSAGILASSPLGFNNTYALAVLRSTADQLQLRTISDLGRHPDLRLGFSNEFMDREDGWKNLRAHYRLPHQNVSGLDHDLAYQQLELGVIDVIDAYTTDAKLQRIDAVLLDDDRAYFPKYEALLLYRKRLAGNYPDLLDSVHKLEGRISSEQMTRLNASVELDGKSESRVAADYLGNEISYTAEVDDESVAGRLWKHTREHLNLVRKSLIPAIFVAIPLGVVAARRPKLGQVILGVVGIVQTIPALALLVLLMPLLAYLGFATIGVGSGTAITALFLYSLLPIVRNTTTGFTGISPTHRESALALGLSPMYRLRHIELPLASPLILAGVKTAAVINVGFATLGALIGAGGYGQPILTGIRLNSTSLIMQGALPAAGLALLFQLMFELLERQFVPKGLRLGRNG